jgi:predicted kinase
VQEPTADEGKGCSHRGGEDNEEGMLFCLSTSADTAATFVTSKRLTSLILQQGYGVIADATIKPRSLIIEYVGEVRGNSAVLVRLNAHLSADRKFMC